MLNLAPTIVFGTIALAYTPNYFRITIIPVFVLIELPLGSGKSEREPKSVEIQSYTDFNVISQSLWENVAILIDAV